MTAPALDGKVAIVTGASYGLGVLFAEVLASAGADIVVTARSVDKLAETKSIVEGLGRRCLAVAGDVTSYDDCAAVVAQTMATFGKIDILVNNAGWADDRLLRTERCEPEMFAKICGIDLRRRPDGEHVCFEVNPMPGYSYFESETGQAISEALVDYLMHGEG
jgi:NAD(P)-dependent dehydrogenase (short-subunit alcohol dehydrogenase family)